MTWYRSPGGALVHADGPSQARAYVDRGYTEVDEATAKAEIGDGIRLSVDSRTAGTFDGPAVRAAVRDEGPARKRRR